MVLNDDDIMLIETKNLVIEIWRDVRKDYIDEEYLKIIDLMRDSAIEALDIQHIRMIENGN